MTIGRPFSTPNKVPAAHLRSRLTEPAVSEQLFVSVAYVDYPKVNDFFIRVFIGPPSASPAFRGSIRIAPAPSPASKAARHTTRRRSWPA